MGQFVFGLLAGVTVGLVMEWVIDWAGLFPGRSVDKTSTNKATLKTKSNVLRAVGQPSLDLTPNHPTPDTSRD